MNTATATLCKSAGAPAWQLLAAMLVGRLNGSSRRDTSPDDDCADETDEDDVAADAASHESPAGEADQEHSMWRPAVHVPARKLLTCLRLAATFGHPDILAPLAKPGAITVLRNIDHADLELVVGVLRTVLPNQGWQLFHPSLSDYTSSKTSDERFQRELCKLIDKKTPALVLLPAGVDLPRHMTLPGIANFTLSPITPDVLQA